MRIYSSWDTKKGFKWKMDLTYEPVWINTHTILSACKLRKGSKLETMSILQNHIDFAKDNLIHIANIENDSDNGNEVDEW